jgi:hypothetical protein
MSKNTRPRNRNDEADQHETQQDGTAQAQPSAARTPSELLRMDKAIHTLIAFLEKHLGQGSSRSEDHSPGRSPEDEDTR